MDVRRQLVGENNILIRNDIGKTVEWTKTELFPRLITSLILYQYFERFCCAQAAVISCLDRDQVAVVNFIINATSSNNLAVTIQGKAPPASSIRAIATVSDPPAASAGDSKVCRCQAHHSP